jgi:hypothetical protein
VGFVDGKLDLISLRQSLIDLPVMTAPVPVTISDFGFELKDLSKIPDDANFLTKVLDTEIGILFNVDVGSLKAAVPKISKFFDDDTDIALAQFEDCALRLKLREIRLSFTSKVKLVSIIDLGELEVSLGCFDYSNRLINMYNEKEVGLRVAAKNDVIKWNSANLELSVSGMREMCIGYPYSGLWTSGNADFSVGWGIWEEDWSVAGDAMIGAFINSSGNFQFSVILRGENSEGDQSGFHAYVTKVDGFKLKLY